MVATAVKHFDTTMMVVRRALLLTRAVVALLGVFMSTACMRGSAKSLRNTGAHGAADCFAMGRLTSARQALARRVLLRAADSEALYTLAASIKPISSGFADFTLRVTPSVDSIALDSLREYQAILPALSCGDVSAHLSVFAATFPVGGDTTVRARFVSLTFVNSVALARTVREHREYFGALGIVPGGDPQSILSLVEFADRATRWRGYGYLFGYPDDAVEFFVRAGTKGDSVDRARAKLSVPTSYVEPRDFRFIETFRKSRSCDSCAETRSSFVYAVDKGAAETAADAALARAAAVVYHEYLGRRLRHISGTRNDIDGLLREWNGDRSLRR